MKTIAVQKEIREMLENYAEETESMDETINRLIDEHNKSFIKYNDSFKTNINVSEETFNRLKDCKMYSTERNVSIISRLLYDSFER